MAVMAREAWTDQRLDQLNERVSAGFEEMRSEFKSVRVEIQKESKALRAEVKEDLRDIRGEMGELRAEVGSFNRAVLQLAWAMIGTTFLGFMGTIAALVTLV